MDSGRDHIHAHYKSVLPTHKEMPLQIGHFFADRCVRLLSDMHFYHTLSFHLQKPLESLVEDVSITKCKNEKAWSLFTT